MHTNYSQMLLEDHFRAAQLPEHNLIQWTDGPFPPFTPSQPIVTPPPVGSNPASSAAVAGMTANPMHGMGGVAAAAGAGDSSMGVSPAAAVAAVPAMGAHDLQSQQQQAALMAQAYQQQQMAAHHHHGQY